MNIDGVFMKQLWNNNETIMKHWPVMPTPSVISLVVALVAPSLLPGSAGVVSRCPSRGEATSSWRPGSSWPRPGCRDLEGPEARRPRPPSSLTCLPCVRLQERRPPSPAPTFRGVRWGRQTPPRPVPRPAPSPPRPPLASVLCHTMHAKSHIARAAHP